MRCPDWIIPNYWGEPVERTPSPGIDLPDEVDTDTLDAIERELTTLRQREDERDRTAQSRLIAILGWSSSLGVLVSGLVALGFRSAPADVARWQVVAALVLLGYISLQIILAAGFAIAGLRPQSYEWVQPSDLVPRAAERGTRFRRRLAEQHARNLVQNTWANNRRYDEMLLARLALRNVAVAVGVFISLALLVSLWRLLPLCIHVETRG